MINVTRLSRIFDFASRIIQTDSEPNRVGEDHSTAHDRIVVQKKAWQKGTLCGVQRITDVCNGQTRPMQVRWKKDQMPQVQCPLLPSRHEGKDTRSHAVQRASDDIPPPYGSVALYTDKITTSYHQHDPHFSLNERIAHHYRINLGWSHRLSILPDMKSSLIYDFCNLFRPQTTVPFCKHIQYSLFDLHIVNPL